MRFNQQHFNRFLNNIGQDVVWRKSFGCACKNPTSGMPDTKCKVCVGKGVFWPGSPVATIVALASQNTQAKWSNNVRATVGDIVVTIPEVSPMWLAGQFDRMVMENGEDRFSYPLMRGAHNEKMFFQILSIERVFSVVPATGVITDYPIPTIGNEGQVIWPTGTGPAAGVTYSITGRMRSEYFIYESFPMNSNSHQGMRLPRKVVMRRFDLWGR
jgi:hypothetical protein